MELFERIRQIIDFYGLSEAKAADALGYHPRTFNGYMSLTRQDNLWPLLPKILELFPQVSRDWLYFEEGEMVGSPLPHGLSQDEITLLQHFRHAPGAGRTAILNVSAVIAHPSPKAF